MMDCARFEATKVFPSAATPLVISTLFSLRVEAILYKRERSVRNRSGPTSPGLVFKNTLFAGSSRHSAWTQRFRSSSYLKPGVAMVPVVTRGEAFGAGVGGAI